ncbi:MAG: AzlC family ABC transporter permease [Anaerolineales bacterium]|jgi:4-azaleucine resistance transporter AzlC
MSAESRPAGFRERRRAFFEGVRDQLPLVLGVAPFGAIFGALAISVGIPALETQAFSLFLFAGSAQFIAVSLIDIGTPVMIVIATIAIVNLRHLLYSIALSPQVQSLGMRWKVPLAWLLTDEAFAIASLRYRTPDTRWDHWYFLGTGLTLWGSWQISTFLGITAGALIPASWQLEFALPLTFMAILAPSLTNRAAWITSITAGVLALLLTNLPLSSGLLISVLGALLLGGWVQELDAHTEGV